MAAGSSHAFDEALGRISSTHPEYSAGGFDTLANHAPMVIEALATMGRGGAIDGYLERVLPTLREFDPLPPHPRAWEDRIGAEIPVAIAAFEHDLAHHDWREVVGGALPRLMPGAITGALHGLLRVAHAVRSLTRADTGPRRRELAHGLGYWAARFCRLPGDPGRAPEPGLDPITALDQVPDLSDAAAHVGLILDRALLVERTPAFAALVARVDFSDDAAAIGAQARAAAELYLARPGNGFSYLHGVTSTSALRLLAPVMDADTRRAARGFVWQGLAAIHASGRSIPDPPAHEPVDPAALPELAARSLDDHTIKFAEALLREHALAPDPIWMRAAAAELARSA